MSRALFVSVWIVGAVEAVAVPVALEDLDMRPMPRFAGEFDVGPLIPDVEESEGPQWIVNGNRSGNTEFPEVVALATIDRWGYGGTFCSGTLINHSWVVTAAHCVDDLEDYIDNGLDLFVMWGTDPFGNHLVEYIEMEQWIPHPDYNPNSSNITSDIGLVELKEARQNASIMLVNDDSMNSNWIDLDLTFVGYGVTSNNGHDGGIQRNTSMPIFTFDSQFVYAYDGTFDSWGNPQYDSTTNLCSGDSGGAGLLPHDSAWQLVGVNSFTVGECEGGYAGATRVDEFLPWIEGYTDVYRDEDEIPPDPPNEEDPDDVDEVFTPDDTLSDGGGWGDPVRPTGENLYGMGCSSGGLMGLTAWWLAALAVARRRQW